HRLDHAWEEPEGGLVAGQPGQVLPRLRPPTRDVRGQTAQERPQLGGHASTVRQTATRSTALRTRGLTVQETRHVPYTLVAFHAHPDDEALLTAGTLARAAAEGHRVVLVVATAGEAGLVEGGRTGPALASRRLAELE